MLRPGKDYLAAIRDGRCIYVGNELVRDVTSHPAAEYSSPVPRCRS
jgi:aromatic ring hydroxylase